MADSNIPKEITNSLKGIFTNINTERLTEILVALGLCFLGFLVARFVSNAFIRTIGKRFNAHQSLVWRRGIFYFIFLIFVMASLKEAGFKLSVFLGAAGILTVALGFASQTSASNLISFQPIADQTPEFGRYQNMTVVIDDGLPVVGATGSERYVSVIANPGAIGYAERQPPGEEGLEYDREPARGNGGGAETLWSRRDFIVHPFGYSFTSDTITGNGTETRPASASWADLVLADNWERKLDRKQVPIAFVTSTVA